LLSPQCEAGSSSVAAQVLVTSDIARREKNLKI
jgi:hypothetical protein